MRTALTFVLALSLACGDDDSAGDASVDALSLDAPDALSLDALSPDGGDEAVAFDFSVVVGSEAFRCGQEYSDLGMNSETWTAQDARLYVHGFELVMSDGTGVPVTLNNDGMWQNGEVALLDFEDGCGEMGNADMNSVVRGRAPAGEYAGVRFRVGVPEALNHANAAIAETPLNLTAMFWNWNGGYKFVRIEGPSTGFAGWRLHLGSTMCEGDMMGDTTCATANRPAVDLRGDSLNGTIQMDLAALFEGSALGNTAESAPGCMSGPDDSDCEALFVAMGLPFASVPAGTQSVFSIRP